MKKKVLIIRLTALGDVIFTLPLVNVLKNNNCEVGYLVAEKGLGVIKNNPAIDKLYLCPLAEWRKRPLSIKTWKEFFKLIFELRKEKYDIALDCQQMLKSLCLLAFCGAKRRITFKDAKELSFLGGNEFVTPKYHFKDNNYHIVERNLDFARYLGLTIEGVTFSMPPLNDTIKQKVDEILKFFEQDEHSEKKPIVVLAPATTWVNKHWNNDNWRELIENIKDKCNLVFTGMSSDDYLVTELGGNNFLNLCGKTNLEELKEILSRAKIVITPDSGTAHLSWALGNPIVITIFTCTSANRFGPYGDKYFSIQGSDCSPCFKRNCKYKTNACTKSPSVESVLNILSNLL